VWHREFVTRPATTARGTFEEKIAMSGARRGEATIVPDRKNTVNIVVT
jgi:hypothetical protein